MNIGLKCDLHIIAEEEGLVVEINFDIHSMKNKEQGTWNKVQGSRYKAQGSRYKAQGSRYKAQGSRLKVQGTRIERFYLSLLIVADSIILI